MRRLLSTLLGICIFSFAGLAASVAAESPSADDAATAEDSLRIEFAAPDGAPQATPYFAVQGAHPGMETQTAVVTLHNAGTVDAAFDVAVVLPPDSGGPRLADVLQVTVTAQGAQQATYRGPLSAMRFNGADVLRPGGSAQYVMALDWPDGGDADNAYQGLALEFDLRGRARQTD